MRQKKLLFLFMLLSFLGCKDSSTKKTDVSDYLGVLPVMPIAGGNTKPRQEHVENRNDDIALKNELLSQAREYCVCVDETAVSYYDILVFPNGQGFDVMRDGKTVLSSSRLNQTQLKQITPLMGQVFDKIVALDQTHEMLENLSPQPKTALAQLTNHESNTHIISRIRFKYRIIHLEKEIIDLIQQSIDLSVTPTQQKTDEKTSLSNEKLDADKSCSFIELRDLQGNLYEIAVSQDVTFFEVKLNSEPVVQSLKLEPHMLEKVTPVMQDVLVNINKIAKDEENLIIVTPKTALGLPVKPSDKNIITRTRLESRIDQAKNLILQNVSNVFEMLKQETEPSNENEEKNEPVKVNSSSSVDQRISFITQKKTFVFQRV